MPQIYSICEKANKKTNVQSAGLQLDLHKMSHTSSLQEKRVNHRILMEITHLRVESWGSGNETVGSC
jgi:hypothetical protein